MRILRRETGEGTERPWEEVVVLAPSGVLAVAMTPFSPTHSSWRRSQLRQPFGLPSHFTYFQGYARFSHCFLRQLIQVACEALV